MFLIISPIEIKKILIPTIDASNYLQYFIIIIEKIPLGVLVYAHTWYLTII